MTEWCGCAFWGKTKKTLRRLRRLNASASFCVSSREAWWMSL